MNLYNFCMQIAVSLIIFVLLVLITRFLLEKVRKTSFKYLNPTEYLPEEEVKSLKQLYYLEWNCLYLY